MDFRTHVEIPKPGFQISHQSKIQMLGSCFTETIGEKLQHNKFKADINPFGIIYNPMSVFQSLEMLLSGKQFLENELEFYNNLWFSYYHHSDFSCPGKDQCLEKINKRLIQSREILKSSDILKITFGTSWVFRHKKSDKVVSNCHKIPASEFIRHRVTTDEIVSVYDDLIRRISSLNPGLQIVFTISPVRHWKDGAHGNQLSKSLILLAVDKLVQMFGHCYYFPSYEIILDELRDYRFYAEDMLHVNETGTNYVWQRFLDTFCASETLDLIKKTKEILQAKIHRPNNANSKEYCEFLKKNLKKALELKEKYPYLDLSDEISFFQKN